MLLLKLELFVIIIFFTKKSNQELYWKFLPSAEFQLIDTSAELDLLNFTKYEYLENIITKTYCLQKYSDGFVSFTDCNYNLKRPATPTSCDFIGKITNIADSRYKNIKIQFNDYLIFLAIEGCSRVDKFGRSTSGIILLVNINDIDYSSMWSVYEWTYTSTSNLPNCSSLCLNIAIEKILIQLKDGEYQRRDPYEHPLDEENLIKSQNDFYVKFSSVILCAMFLSLVVVKLVLSSQALA